MYAIEVAAGSFASADLPDLVIRLEEATQELFRASESVLQTMIQTQDRWLLGDAGVPGSWLEETGSTRAACERYRFYADTSRVTSYHEPYTA